MWWNSQWKKSKVSLTTAKTCFKMHISHTRDTFAKKPDNMLPECSLKVHTVLIARHILLRKVSLSTRARTQSSCTVSVLIYRFCQSYEMMTNASLVNGIWHALAIYGREIPGHGYTSGWSKPYSAVSSYCSLIGRLDIDPHSLGG